MTARKKKEQWIEFVWSTAGCFLFAFGVNIIITPLGLYNGGFMGIAQLIRTVLFQMFDFSFLKQIDIAGIVYYIINIPIFYWAFREMGKGRSAAGQDHGRLRHPEKRQRADGGSLSEQVPGPPISSATQRGDGDAERRVRGAGGSEGAAPKPGPQPQLAARHRPGRYPMCLAQCTKLSQFVVRWAGASA